MKPLPLPEMPAPPVKAQGEPVGAVLELAGPHRHLLEARVGDSASASASASATSATIWSTKAVLSPPALSRPWNVIVCDPAVTVNAAVV